MNKPTEEYSEYQKSFDYFNNKCFDGLLPPCLITFQRWRYARGYFSPEHFAARTNRTLRTDEICQLEQAHFGKPGRSGYHNKPWARVMLRVGLQPISHDHSGRMTGRSVTHEIVPGGRADVAANWLLAIGFRQR